MISDPLPAGWTPEEEPDCDTHYVPPTVDLLLATMTTSYAFCDGFICPTSMSERAIPLLVAALFWKATYNGWSETSRCARARAEHDAFEAGAASP